MTVRSNTRFPDSMHFHINTPLSTMTAAWLLPIVPTIVAAASGGIVADVLPNPRHALWKITTSYILWGTGVPRAMTTLVVYFQRLTVQKLPSREVIVSCFLSLGRLGQGAFGIMQLGKVSMQLFPKTGTLAPLAGQILYVVGFLMALILWGFGLVLVFLRYRLHQSVKIPIQYGVVEFCLPHWSVHGCNHHFW